MNEDEAKISWPTFGLMLLVALFFDAVQALIGLIAFFGGIIPGAGLIVILVGAAANGLVSLVAFIVFLIWFWTKNINIFMGKRMIGTGLTGLLEFFGLGGLFLGWVGFVVYHSVDGWWNQSSESGEPSESAV